MTNTPVPLTPPNPSGVHAAQRLASIAQARLMALHERTALPAGWVAPWIERSWARCISLGLQPNQTALLDPVTQSQRRRTTEANQQLVQTAKPVLESLGRAIANTRYFAILTNADGVVVDVSGPVDRSDDRADRITQIGADLSESSIGTTAIGAALTELQPVWLHRGEHFLTSNSPYSCAGAPLFGPDGRCVGMLDVTGIDAVERPELKHLLTQSASKIENALLLAQPHRLMVRLNWPGSNMGGEADGIVCLDSDGWITGANPAARQMVPDLVASGAPRRHVSELFGVPFEMLFDALRHPDATLEIPLWTGLTLQALPIAPADEQQTIASRLCKTLVGNLPLKDLETALIHQAVEKAKGNVAQAAQQLGISRATVYRKLGLRRPPP